jgi:hypothetical protein
MIKSYSPYVYLGINRTTSEFYIGARYSHCKHKRNSVDDLGVVYYTSSKKVKPLFDQFDWQILAIFVSKEDALAYEEMLINEHWHNPLLLNKNKGGKKFHRPSPEEYGKKLYQPRPYIKKESTRRPGAYSKKLRSNIFKKIWSDPDFKEKMVASRQRTHTTKEFREAHSIAMKKVSKQSKQICRVCRLSDRKEMTVQNFSRYS